MKTGLNLVRWDYSPDVERGTIQVFPIIHCLKVYYLYASAMGAQGNNPQPDNSSSGTQATFPGNQAAPLLPATRWTL